MANMKKVLVLLFGGQSSEHEISCKSARTILNALDREQYEVIPVGVTRGGRWVLVDEAADPTDESWTEGKTGAYILPDAEKKCLLICGPDGCREQKIDVVFPAFHGRFGEDGTIQGLLELAQIPYVGCGVTSSAVCMDKLFTKQIVEKLGIAQAEYVFATQEDLRLREESVIAEAEQKLGYPVFVKPSDAGSSRGVERAANREELRHALKVAAPEGTRVIVERAIIGRELECGVLSDAEGVRALGAGEILSGEAYYSYDAKYLDASSRVELHPELPEGKLEELKSDAEKIFTAVCGKGLSRVDFFLEEGTNRVIFNEVNTLPGFTSISMYPKQWMDGGRSLSELLDRLIADALRKE